ncbi:nitrate reductase [Phlegmacium glaucopus]|nr:nitrate reductase [Phlegmacium glaucopus]
MGQIVQRLCHRMIPKTSGNQPVAYLSPLPLSVQGSGKQSTDPKYGVECFIPRELPSTLDLPLVPNMKASVGIDTPDIGTPDAWIPRDPKLVRLTGKHPFNAEAKLRELYAQGFITPSNLFYVRNHGAVPKVDQNMADKWELKIHGLCANPSTLTLTDLRTKFRVITIPVTLVCAGNRRKEQNVVQKSLGFSWGAAGLSTALFTGVYLSDVLDYIRPTRKAKHVVFEGSDDDLPNGPYGTSQLLNWARDKRRGMILAWAMNGLPLEPDHGFPLRLVVPAQIGGRSVKWLSRIELSDIESQHYLHFHDNRVLPTTLGPDRARAEKEWWYDPRYIIRDLNVNSAIACPDHHEILDTTNQPTYTVKGYAYAGGGRRVTRVEVSSDDGDTWSLANISYPEDLFREVTHFDPVYGSLDLTEFDTCFCWCFWSLEIETSVLKTSKAIMVRSMDESMALQPRDMYWNATGMMNNWWFRVCIHPLDEGMRLRFEHPTMAGTQPGGWMQRLKDKEQDPSKPQFSDVALRSYPNKRPVKEVPMTKPHVIRKITVEDLKSLEAKENAWFVVRGEVYNGSGFFKDHPGGAQSIMLVAGEDATEDFMAIHSSDAKKQLADFHIGTLFGDITKTVEEDESSGPFLNPKKWKKVVLTNVKEVSANTKVFRFSLPSQEQELGLPFGQHVYVRLRRKIAHEDIAQGQLVQRAYTPLSERRAKGFIDLLIKIYYPNAEFPKGGLMTLGVSELVLGDAVELKGPVGHFNWKGRGMVSLHDEERHVSEIGLICAGSGITPILQVLRAILTDPLDFYTKVWVLDVNRFTEDILCREELDRLASEHGSRFRLHYNLTGKPVPSDWSYSTGRVTSEILKAHMPTPGQDKLVCICGPSPMEQSIKSSLCQIGWDLLQQVVLF